jgi:hypothetical protein
MFVDKSNVQTFKLTALVCCFGNNANVVPIV